MLNVLGTYAPGPARSDRRTRVLSVQYSHLGIATYSRTMRDHFAASSTCAVDSFWFDQDKALSAQLVRRALLLDDKQTGSWARRRNLDLYRLRSDLGMAVLASSLARRKVHAFDYSVLHFHTQPLAYLCADLMRRVPTVIHLDDTAASLARQTQRPGWRWTFGPNRRLDRHVFDAAARLVSWSEWAARSLTEDYGVDPARVRVVPPGVDFARFPYPAARQGGRAAGPVRLLFAGYDFARKGGHDLLAVFLSQFAASAELHLMTSAPVSCDHPRVFVHRGVAAYTPEWHALYRNADVFAMPTYQDTFGMVYLEAMAAGLPVIGSRISAIPEIVEDGETGFLVRPGDRQGLADALRRLIGDADLRAGMGARGRARAAARFDARVNFGALEAVFHDAAQGRPPGVRAAS